MNVLKFRRAHFFDEEKTKFSHFSYWGVDLQDGNPFASPQSNNFAPYFTDDQYTGIKDNVGTEIYRNDILMWSDDDKKNPKRPWIVKWENMKQHTEWYSNKPTSPIVFSNVYINQGLIKEKQNELR